MRATTTAAHNEAADIGECKDGINSKRTLVAVERRNAVTLHFVRHAQATHNAAAEKVGRAAYYDWAHLDARLTDLGREQARGLGATLGTTIDEIQMMVVSPMSRALETASIAFEKVPSHIPWIALECARERAGNHPCDKRRTRTELKEQFPHIDWSLIESDSDELWDTLGEDRETDEMMMARAHDLFEWIRARPETNIAIVTHSAYLSVLFNKAVRCGEGLQTWFNNAEMRSTLMQL
eukprot:TRINITY_DN7763_c0_g1_i1.p1 TRINITY_DN7763_c0_g1~~TRINITY_DN7763_c0_g1_i1.p1  ORF type:complete len:237 (-),score=44.46 TRINITY_DN7763_c0_g1_i1:303-1013(-)